MISLLNGPATGVVLSLRRAPIYLRVTRDPAAPEHNRTVRLKRDRRPEWDGLDQPEDVIRDGEEIHVYRRTAYHGPVFVRPGGRYEMADYRHVELPDGQRERFRDNGLWREWCLARPEARPRAEHS